MAARHLPPLRTFTPAPETQRQTESHRRATSSPGSHTSVFGLSPMAHTLDMAEQDTGTAIAAERTKTPVERTPSPPLGSTNVSRDQEGLSRTPSGRSFSARKRILAGVLGESPLPVLLLGGIAMLLLLALLLKNNTITLSAALYDVRQHLRLAFRGGPTRPPRFSLRVKCGSDTVPSGPIGSSEGCLVIAPSCSETWVAVLDAGEERVIDGLCRDESAGVALITQRCDGTCRDIPPEQQNKPQDVWTPILTKEFVIDSIGAKGALAGSIYDPWTRVILPQSSPVTVSSYPLPKIELPWEKPAKKSKRPRPNTNATATLLRFPVLGTRAVIGETIPLATLQKKNMSGWMEELWSVGGFRHIFEGICDLRASEMGCGGRNDGIVFPDRRWHMNIYTLEQSNYESSSFFIEDIFRIVSWRWLYLVVGVLLLTVVVVSLRPFAVRRTPGRLAKLKSMTFVEHDIARVQQELAKMSVNR